MHIKAEYTRNGTGKPEVVYVVGFGAGQVVIVKEDLKFHFVSAHDLTVLQYDLVSPLMEQRRDRERAEREAALWATHKQEAPSD